jgi:predicted metalloprotease with PDZ domain
MTQSTTAFPFSCLKKIALAFCISASCLGASFALTAPAHAMVLQGGVEQTIIMPSNEPGIVGMDIKVPQRGYPVIKQVLHHSPAQQVGLQAGDVIIKIDGRLAEDKTAKAIDVAISDIPGTPVTFTVQRATGEYKTLTLIVAASSHVANQSQQALASTHTAVAFHQIAD